MTQSEVAAREEHNRTRRRHAHDADALLRIGCRWLRCCRASGLGLFGWRAIEAMPPQLLGASDEVFVSVDLHVCFPLLVGPEAFDEVLTRGVIVT